MVLKSSLKGISFNWGPTAFWMRFHRAMLRVWTPYLRTIFSKLPPRETRSPWLLISGDSRAQQYTLQLIDLQKAKCNCGSADGPEIKFEGHLVQLGSHRFLDAVSQSDAEGMDAIPAHNIFKITAEGDSLSLMA